MTIAVTQTSARYQPLAQIGRGGMGEVILAEMQVGPGVTGLAILKRLSPEMAADPDLVTMFRREARLAARMNHPNVVRTYEILEEAAGPTIAMEYLDGQPLARVLNRLMGSGALGLPARLRVLIDVLAALDYAHQLRDASGSPLGIVHRDVNPQNVFVTYDGTIKLLDFGIAKSAGDPCQTRPGELRGKLAYLAPEQALGEVVDRRADIFSVGVMLWELMAGRRMWHAMTESAIMKQLTAGVIPPLPRAVAVPPKLAELCARALARSPARRFATAREFSTELQRLLPAGDEGTGRHLGRIVGLAFGPERAARRTLIEEHLRRARVVAPEIGGTRLSGMVPSPFPGGASGDLPQLRAERATPGGMWALDDRAVAEIVELSLDDVIVEDGPGTRSASRFRRAGWVAVGVTLAGAFSGAAYAARSVRQLPVTVTRLATSMPVAAPIRPLIVSSPVACGGVESHACSRALAVAGAGSAPTPLASPAATEASGRPDGRVSALSLLAPFWVPPGASDATAGAREAGPSNANSTTRRHRRRGGSTDALAGSDDGVAFEARGPEVTPAPARKPRPHPDDETLEPTIDLRVRVIDVTDPFDPVAP